MEALKSELEKTFPPWRIVVTDRSRWWALRGPLPPEQLNEVDTVEADTAEQLRDKLAELVAVVL
ncbi:hypothetical protein [Actinomadura chokoriensis]|uniref:Uncharacterized protein n=1 Tax=Actinomadura chokoriensis TaxID=454156 RepID=A0ABV4QSL0_9ACTN